jgi:hypothetical protein
MPGLQETVAASKKAAEARMHQLNDAHLQAIADLQEDHKQKTELANAAVRVLRRRQCFLNG